jgi:hypothetical protein
MLSTFAVASLYMVHEDRQNNRPLVINLLIELLPFLSGYIHVTIVKHLPSLQLQVLYHIHVYLTDYTAFR